MVGLLGGGWSCGRGAAIMPPVDRPPPGGETSWDIGGQGFATTDRSDRAVRAAPRVEPVHPSFRRARTVLRERDSGVSSAGAAEVAICVSGRKERAAEGPLDVRRLGVQRPRTHLVEARAAVHRAIVARREGHHGLPAAGTAHRGVELARAFPGPRALGRGAARRAALRIVGEALARVEGLFPAEKVNSSAQSRRVKLRSWYTLSRPPKSLLETPWRTSHGIGATGPEPSA